MDKAEDMLNEDVEGERMSTLSCSPQQSQISEGQVGEVRKGLAMIQKYTTHLYKTCTKRNKHTRAKDVLYHMLICSHLSVFL